MGGSKRAANTSRISVRALALPLDQRLLIVAPQRREALQLGQILSRQQLFRHGKNLRIPHRRCERVMQKGHMPPRCASDAGSTNTTLPRLAVLYCRRNRSDDLVAVRAERRMARHPETAAKTPLLAVTEAMFGRHVLASPLPVLALFGTQTCPASQALRPLLQDLAAVDDLAAERDHDARVPFQPARPRASPCAPSPARRAIVRSSTRVARAGHKGCIHSRRTRTGRLHGHGNWAHGRH